MLNKLKYILQKRNLRQIDIYDLDMEQVRKMVEKGAILLDVRSPQEYAEGHLKNSILIPEYEIKTNAKNMLPNKYQIIIVYCSSGIRSKRAQKILQQMGYSKVYNLYQGLEGNN